MMVTRRLSDSDVIAGRWATSKGNDLVDNGGDIGGNSGSKGGRKGAKK